MVDGLAALIEQHLLKFDSRVCECGTYVGGPEGWATHVAERVRAIGAGGRPDDEDSPVGAAGCIAGRWDGETWWVGSIPLVSARDAHDALPEIREKCGGHIEVFALYPLRETARDG